MVARPFLTLTALALAACSSAEEIAEETGVSRDAAEPQAEASATASVSSGGARSLNEKTDLYFFEQKWPRQVGAIPALAERLDAEGKESKRQLLKEAEDDRRSAAENDYPYRAHSYGEEWKVVADLARFLSLSNEFYTYAGGAHGNSGFDALVWDRERGRAMKAIDFFPSMEALSVMLGEPFCDALYRERVAKRGAHFDPTSDDMFEACPGLDETTIILGSSNGRAFDRIGFLIGPYIAGPYAEGSYDVTLPFTTALVDLVRPEFRDSFAPARN